MQEYYSTVKRYLREIIILGMQEKVNVVKERQKVVENLDEEDLDTRVNQNLEGMCVLIFPLMLMSNHHMFGNNSGLISLKIFKER